jgi:hypothetical protein
MRLPLLLLLLASSVPVASVAGQAAVRVEGRVVADEDQRPLAFADITVRRTNGQFVMQLQADSLGRFEFAVRGVPAVQLRVQRLGYRTNTTPVLHFDNRSYFQVEVRLDAEAILLAPLEVKVWSEVGESPFLDNFRHRLETGLGTYITRREIEARNPFQITDMLRTVPGVHLESSGRGGRPRVRFGRAEGARGGMACDAQIFVDGMLMNRPGADRESDRIDEYVTPRSVEGIEVYRGLATVPAEFLTPDAQCGVVAIWTRRGGRPGGGGDA